MVSMDDLKNKKTLIVKSNQLAEASYRLSLQEMRFVLLITAMINPEDEDFKTYKIKLSDFNKFFEVKNEACYSRAKELTKKLMKRVILIKNPDGDEEDSELQLHWISKAKHAKGNIEIDFHPDLKPYLLGLKGRFTQYYLVYAKQISSFHSIRIYEFLKKDEKIGGRVRGKYYELNELRKCLGIKDGEYKRYSHFKNRILLTAQKDILEKTDIIFTFKEKKRGRKIIGVTLFSEPKEEAIQIQPETEKDRNLIKLIELGFEDAQNIINRFSTKDWEMAFAELEFNVEQEKKKGKEISNPGGWLRAKIRTIPEGEAYIPSPAYKKHLKEQEKEKEKTEQKAKKKEEQKLIKTLEDEFQIERNAQLNEIKNDLERLPAKKEDCLKKWEEEEINKNAFLKRHYQKDKNSPMIKEIYDTFLIEEFLPKELQSFIQYASSKGYKIDKNNGEYSLLEADGEN